MKITLEELEDFAADFVSKLEKSDTAKVIGLSGNLGAGKTTFTQQVAKKLGILQESITSPTFVIMKKYELENQVFDNFIHIDAYRLESGKELEVLDFNEILKDSNNLIFIEWPEKVLEVLPKNITNINFEVVDEKSREIKYA